MTDIHLVGRQNEGIWGIDPVRHGRVAAGAYVDSKSRNTSKTCRLSGVTPCNPDKCINEHFVHMACFNKCEKLRLSEIFEENQR
jgi:hypothetical protein